MDFDKIFTAQQEKGAVMRQELIQKEKKEKPAGLRPDGLASPVSYRFDLIPAEVLMKVAEVMAEGIATGHKDDGWKEVDINDLLNHAMGHVVKFMMGKVDEDHLSHAIVRLMMAWWKQDKGRCGTPFSFSPFGDGVPRCVPRYSKDDECCHVKGQEIPKGERL